MAIYYVSPSGTDGAGVPGSSGSPWKTLNYANKQRIAAGDTVRVRTGTYYESLTITKNNVIFEADTGHTPTIDGRYGPHLFGAAGFKNSAGRQVTSDELPGPTAFNAQLGNWVVFGDFVGIVSLSADGSGIRGFVIRNVCGRAVTMTGNNTVFENCRTDFTYQTCVTSDNGQGHRIRNNVITRSSMKYFDPGRSGNVATTVIVKSKDTIVEGNMVAYNYGEGISADKGSVRVIIRNNVIHTNNHWPLGINSASNATFYNNITYVCENLYSEFGGNISGAFVLGDEKGAFVKGVGGSIGTKVWNNLFIGCNATLLSSGGSDPTATRLFCWDQGYFGYNTIVSLPHTTRATVVLQQNEVKNHRNSVWENNIFLAHPNQTGGFFSINFGGGGILFRNNVGNRALPGIVGNNGIVSPGTAGLKDPFVAISGVYNRKSTALPDPFNTTFNPANYDLTNSSVAVGRAAQRVETLNGLTVPVVNYDRYNAGRTDFNAAQGRYYDIGADEYDASSPPVDPPTITASFNRSPASGNAPLTVNFTDTSTKTGSAVITGWSWNFGDGTTSTSQNPTKVYSTAGTYTVSLTISDAGNSLTSTFTGGTVTVTAVETGSVTARFSRSPAAGEAGVTSFSFTDTSTVTGNGVIDSWEWDFRDGTGSTSQNPSKTYAAAGTYRPRLTVRDTVRGYSSVFTGPEIVVSDAPPPKSVEAGFSASVAGGQAPLSVTFTDMSLVAGGASITSWSWVFGDGNTSASQNPVHTYAAPGVYVPRLTIVDAVNGLTDVRVGSAITVTAVSPPAAGNDVRLRQNRVALNTSNGNQTFSQSGLGGLVPKSARFVVTPATADGTAVDGAGFGYGATAGGAQWAAANAAQHGVADTNSARKWTDAACLLLVDGNGNELVRATFVAWTADGVTVNVQWTGTPAAYLVQVVLGAGTEYEAFVGTAALGAAGSSTVVSCGFAADLVRGVATWGARETGEVDATISLGLAHRTGGQYVLDRRYADGLADGANRMRLFEGQLFQCRYNTSARADARVTAWGSSGFTLGVSGDVINSTGLVMAEKFGSVASRVALVESGVATGNKDYTLGWDPQYAEHLISQATALGSYNDAPKAGTIGIHVATDDGEYSAEISGENGSATTNEQSLSDNQLIVVGHTGTTLAAGATSLGAGKYTVNYATAPGTAMLWPALAVQEGQSTGGGGAYVSAEFEADVAGGIVPLRVRFTDLSSGSSALTSWAWDFGDGGISNERNPTHVYASGGDYTVSLTVSNGTLSDTESKSGYISAVEPVKRVIIVGPFLMRAISEASVSVTHKDPEDKANGGYMEAATGFNALRLNADPEVPAAVTGDVVIYSDTESGDLKVKRPDGTTGTVDVT